MSEEMNIARGMIIEKCGKRYRILSLCQGCYQMIEMDIDRTNITIVEYAELNLMLRNKEIQIIAEDSSHVVDEANMPQRVKDIFEKRKTIIAILLKECNGDYLSLNGKSPKRFIEQAIEVSGLSRKYVLQTIRRYLQGGMTDAALVDRRSDRTDRKNPVTINRKSKTGPHTDAACCSGKVLTEEDLNNMAWGVEAYKTNRVRSIHGAYLYMLDKYYTVENAEGGRQLLPENQFPKERQFTYFVNKVLSKVDKEIIKTSRSEYRNNHRVLTGDTISRAIGPGYMVELDALEPDFYLISEIDPEQPVGRCYIYMMIDGFTKAAVAAAISFEDNSEVGLTNLFLNLIDDKSSWATGNGVTISLEAFVPGFIPHTVVCDRGSDFKSNAFGVVCNRWHMERELVTGATGSYKGNVEQAFRQFQNSYRAELVNKGLIQKRYDSEHKQQACLTKTEMAKLVIAFMQMRNTTVVPSFRLTPNMIESGFLATPINLWHHYCGSQYEPRPITEANRNQLIFDLMEEQQASISRSGLTYKQLVYINTDDPWFEKQMAEAALTGTKTITIRLDMRDVGTIYYTHNNKIFAARLNTNLFNQVEYLHMTWSRYLHLLKARKALEQKAGEIKLKNEIGLIQVGTFISDSAGPACGKSSKSEVRKTKSRDKEIDNYENRISKRIPSIVPENEIACSESTLSGEPCTVTTSAIHTDESGSKIIPIGPMSDDDWGDLMDSSNPFNGGE